MLEIERNKIIDEIVGMFPELEQNKHKIKKQIEKKLRKKRAEEEIQLQHTKEIVLEKIQYKDVFYYKDKFGSLLNDKAEIVGITKKNPVNKKELIFELFEDCQNLKKELELELKIVDI